MNGMRILHVIDSSGIYGAETVLLNLATEQRARGDAPLLLSLGGQNVAEKAIETEARRLGIRCLPLRMRDGLNLAAGREILRIAEDCRADIIHSHGYKGNILLGLQRRATRGVPVVTTLHGWTATSTWSKLGLYRALDQRMLSRLDGVVLVNDAMRRLPVLARLRPPPVTIANGVTSANPGAKTDAALMDSIAALRARSSVLFGVVGRLSPEKNVAELVEALHACTEAPRAGLVILGTGPERDAVAGTIARLKLGDRVLPGGYVANARDYLPAFDALVIPSLTEGLPMVLLEAMAASLPVIATRVGEIPTVLGDLGLLVPPADRSALTAALATLANNLPRFSELGARAAERVAREYGAAAMAGRYAEVYRTVLARKSP
jgi:glycosyltransferase involved in cell wall biosynthesis